MNGNSVSSWSGVDRAAAGSKVSGRLNTDPRAAHPALLVPDDRLHLIFPLFILLLVFDLAFRNWRIILFILALGFIGRLGTSILDNFNFFVINLHRLDTLALAL